MPELFLPEIDRYCDRATQIAAPSNEVAPPRLTVRFEMARLTAGGGGTPAAQGTAPACNAGTLKLIWYKPGYPGVKPVNKGGGWIAPLAAGLDGSAFGWKLKSRLNVCVVGVGCFAACPEGTAGFVAPKPTAYATNSSPAAAGFVVETSAPFACVTTGWQGSPPTGDAPVPPGRSGSQTVRIWI